jgi:hypothetical protein
MQQTIGFGIEHGTTTNIIDKVNMPFVCEVGKFIQRWVFYKTNDTKI